jgi:hypothetical protein
VANFTRLRALHADLASTIVPTTLERLAPAHLRALGDRISDGGVVENGSYLGLPLLVVGVGVAIFCRRRRLAEAAAWCAGIAFVCSLGAMLVVDGHHTGVPLPFDLVERVPLLRDEVAARYSVLVQLGFAVLLAVGIDEVLARLDARSGAASASSGRPRSLRVAAVYLVGVAVLVPLVPALPYPWAPTKVPPLFTTAAVSAIPSGAVVLSSPYPIDPNDEAMLWQAESKMRFRLVGGYAIFRDKAGTGTLTPPVLPPWYRPHGRPVDLRATIVAFVRRYRVDAVVADSRGTIGVYLRKALTRALGPPRHIGGVYLWTGLDPLSKVRSATP